MGKYIVENIYDKYMSLETAEILMVLGGGRSEITYGRSAASPDCEVQNEH